jgi:hypothetical protein
VPGPRIACAACSPVSHVQACITEAIVTQMKPADLPGRQQRQLVADFYRADAAWHQELLLHRKGQQGPYRSKVIEGYRAAIKAVHDRLTEEGLLDFPDSAPLHGLALEMKEHEEFDSSVTPHMPTGGDPFGENTQELRRECWILLRGIEARLSRREDAELSRLLDQLGEAEQQVLLVLRGGSLTTKAMDQRLPTLGDLKRVKRTLDEQWGLIEQCGRGSSKRGSWKLTDWGRVVAEALHERMQRDKSPT